MNTVKVKNLDRVVVVTPQKDLLGYQESDDFKHCLGQAIDHGTKYLVVNLRKVGFMTSAGLGILIEMHKRIKTAGGSMKLCNLNEKTNHLIALVKLEKEFAIYESEEEAIASFAE